MAEVRWKYFVSLGHKSLKRSSPMGCESTVFESFLCRERWILDQPGLASLEQIAKNAELRAMILLLMEKTSVHALNLYVWMDRICHVSPHPPRRQCQQLHPHHSDVVLNINCGTELKTAGTVNKCLIYVTVVIRLNSKIYLFTLFQGGLGVALVKWLKAIYKIFASWVIASYFTLIKIQSFCNKRWHVIVRGIDWEDFSRRFTKKYTRMSPGLTKPNFQERLNLRVLFLWTGVAEGRCNRDYRIIWRLDKVNRKDSFLTARWSIITG